MSRKKNNQHIIPKCYLKAFKSLSQKNPNALKNKKGQENLFVYEKDNRNWSQKGYGKNSIFTKRNYYDLNNDEGFDDSQQYIENYFNDFEAIYPEVLDNLTIGNYDEISNEDMFKFIHFLYLQMARNSDFIDSTEKIFNEINKMIEDMYIANKKPVNPSNLIESYSGARLGIADEDYKITKKLMNNGFVIIENKTRIPFISSDKTYFRGLNEFMFVLSPKLAILFPKNEIIEHQLIELNEEQVINLNNDIYNFASRYIISNIELEEKLFIKNNKKKEGNLIITCNTKIFLLNLKKAYTNEGYITLVFNSNEHFKEIKEQGGIRKIELNHENGSKKMTSEIKLQALNKEECKIILLVSTMKGLPKPEPFIYN